MEMGGKEKGIKKDTAVLDTFPISHNDCKMHLLKICNLKLKNILKKKTSEKILNACFLKYVYIKKNLSVFVV